MRTQRRLMPMLSADAFQSQQTLPGGAMGMIATQSPAQIWLVRVIGASLVAAYGYQCSIQYLVTSTGDPSDYTPLQYLDPVVSPDGLTFAADDYLLAWQAQTVDGTIEYWASPTSTAPGDQDNADYYTSNPGYGNIVQTLSGNSLFYYEPLPITYCQAVIPANSGTVVINAGISLAFTPTSLTVTNPDAGSFANTADYSVTAYAGIGVFVSGVFSGYLTNVMKVVTGQVIPIFDLPDNSVGQNSWKWRWTGDVDQPNASDAVDAAPTLRNGRNVLIFQLNQTYDITLMWVISINFGDGGNENWLMGDVTAEGIGFGGTWIDWKPASVIGPSAPTAPDAVTATATPSITPGSYPPSTSLTVDIAAAGGVGPYAYEVDFVQPEAGAVWSINAGNNVQFGLDPATSYTNIFDVAGTFSVIVSVSDSVGTKTVINVGSYTIT